MTLLILLTLAARNSSSAQYVKKIGGEEKIIISKSEGEKINFTFDSLNTLVLSQNNKIDSLLKLQQSVKDSLKLEISSLFRAKNVLNNQNRINLDTLNDYKSKYYKSVDLYNQYKKDIKYDLKMHILDGFFFGLVIYFLYSQMK